MTLWTLSLLLAQAATGVVVESVGKGLPADVAGVRAGDVLVSWRVVPGRERQDLPAGGTLSSPFDLEYLEVQVAPRVPVVLSGQREGRPIEIRVEGGEWKARSRPALGATERVAFDDVEVAAANGDWSLACWLALRRVDEAPPGSDDEASEALAVAADTCVGDSGAEKGAVAQQALARGGLAQRRYAEAEAAWREALRRWEAVSPRSLGVAAALQGLGSQFWERGLPDDAEPHFRRALSLREELAPDSLEVAATLDSLGRVALWQTRTATALDSLKRAVELRQRLAPRSLLLAESLLSLGLAFRDEGALEESLGTIRRALDSASVIEPGAVMVGHMEVELGHDASYRGDTAGAEAAYRRALAIGEAAEPEGRLVARSLSNLGNVAMVRGEFGAAEMYNRRSLALKRRKWPDSLNTAGSLQNFAELMGEQRRFVEAAAFTREAVAVGERAARLSGTYAFILVSAAELSQAGGDQAAFERYAQQLTELLNDPAWPGSLVDRADILLGQVALSQGKLVEAEDRFVEAIAVLRRFQRYDEPLASAYRQLGLLHRRKGLPSAAADDYRLAVEILEGMRVRMGGGGRGRLGFGVRYAQLYQEAIEVLLEAGRPAEAFHFWERSRARALLEMVAERDIAVDADLPAELRKRRRALEAEYDRTQAALAGAEESGQRDELARRLSELEPQRQKVVEEARRASPRLASVAYPQPLDVEQARQALDPGTALLAYSVGLERTVLFVLTRESGGRAQPVEAAVIALGSEALGARIAAWRRLAERSAPPPAFFAEARALYDLLVRPAEPLLASAKRLVVCPDGPLHRLPFAALRRGNHYLVEWKPLTLGPSASVLRQLIESRPVSPGAPRLVAFGDPRAPGLPDVAGSGREVAAIAALFPGSRAYLGTRATEPRMEEAARGSRYIHFAGHGVLDEHLPLESALAFTPAPGESGPDSGRLHAWEVFERVRLEADLVTLSACHSAAGKEVAGEGLLGLTRAFHYAGARSVLASLWRVPDRSTPQFMRRLYGPLQKGLPKDEALRRAQVASIRDGHHPVRWAGFQLYGDWR